MPEHLTLSSRMEYLASWRVLVLAVSIVLFVACDDGRIDLIPTVDNVAPTESTQPPRAAVPATDEVAATSVIPPKSELDEIEISIVESVNVSDDLASEASPLGQTSSSSAEAIQSLPLSSRPSDSLYPTADPIDKVVAPRIGLPTPETPPAHGPPTESVGVGTTISLVVINPDGTIVSTATFQD